MLITCGNNQTMKHDDLADDMVMLRNELEESGAHEKYDKDKNKVLTIVKENEFDISIEEDGGFYIHEKDDLEKDDFSISLEAGKDDSSTEDVNKECLIKFDKGGSEKFKESKASLFGRLAIKTLIMSEIERVRLFDRKLNKKEKTPEKNNFPGVIVDNQRTKFAACINCCEVFCQSALKKMLNHECKESISNLHDQHIENSEKRNISIKEKFRKYFTKLSIDKVKCNQCGLETKTISAKKHIRKVHGIDLNNHMCPECGKKFIMDVRVRQHQVEDHGYVAEFSCEFCEKIFVKKCLLTNHQQLKHTDEKPHVCDICAQRFKTKGHFNRHKAIHTGERNFPCRFCTMAFSTEWTRTQHERIHLGIKPYKCNLCENQFGQKTSLDSHYKVHHPN